MMHGTYNVKLNYCFKVCENKFSLSKQPTLELMADFFAYYIYIPFDKRNSVHLFLHFHISVSLSIRRMWSHFITVQKQCSILSLHPHNIHGRNVHAKCALWRSRQSGCFLIFSVVNAFTEPPPAPQIPTCSLLESYKR